MDTNRDAPAYLSPSLRAEYDRLADQLSPATRYRDAAIIARALHEGYVRGRVDALAELVTSAQAAAALGVSKQRLSILARARKVGWEIGNERLYRPEDLAALRVRVNGRPRKPSPA